MENYQPLTITPEALERVRSIMKTKSVGSDYGLRITAQGTGCLGHNLGLGFDKQKASDFVFSMGDLQVLIDKKIMIYVAGQKLELAKEGDSEGLRFINAE